jgi:hypothetical protein
MEQVTAKPVSNRKSSVLYLISKFSPRGDRLTHTNNAPESTIENTKPPTVITKDIPKHTLKLEDRTQEEYISSNNPYSPRKISLGNKTFKRRVRSDVDDNLAKAVIKDENEASRN